MGEIQLQDNYGLFINGEFRPASDEKTFVTENPANGQPLANIAQATEADVDAAVQAAWEAFGKWKDTPVKKRAGLLNKIADIIDQNADLLATVETLDNGKPYRETRYVDIPEASAHFRYFAGCILADEGSATMIGRNTLSIVLPEAIGVVGQIVPWNFPLMMGAWKLAPALASGCCTVFKPSSETSLSILELTRLIQDVLPPGVLNVITGSGGRAGRFMLDHNGFSKLAFTGSTEVGGKVALAAADRIIPSTLELGGKSANIFFDDCQWDMAMDGLQMGILFNQGQVCCAGSRVFVQDTIYDRFVEEACEAFQKIKIGNPMDPDTQMGAIISERQLDKVLSYIEIAESEGATIACGGKRATGGDLDNGYFMQPTILTNVDNHMRVCEEEIFGPVACVLKFHDEEEVVEMANDSVFGLAGAVWTRDINRAIRVARGVHTGRMWVNTYNQVPAGAPFGGVKASGFGRECHKSLLDHYRQTKSIMINLSEKPSNLYPQG